MKAVVYHADAQTHDGRPAGKLYSQLFVRFRKHVNDFGMKLVHLTLAGFPGWGDENYYIYGHEARNVVANREEAFTTFLDSAPDDVYWFTEADCTIYNLWPPLTTDCAMLYRKDAKAPMCPAWRMARPSALPFFIALRDAMRAEPGKNWHGDTEAFNKTWVLMGSPKSGIVDFKGVKIEMRDYTHYVKHSGRYSRYAFERGQKEKLCTSL